jgi:radical SAM protein with 4Fe4S-binding SPASM domain
MDVRQVALGGGNPNQHPKFTKILDIIRQKYHIIPSYTTNGTGITDDIIRATKNNCGVVAVSISEFDEEKWKIIDTLVKNDIKTNIHFVVTSETIKDAISILENIRTVPDNLNAIIFLNYKPVGKFSSEGLKAKYSEEMQYFFSLVEYKKTLCNIGFDSCFVSGICKFTNINQMFYDFCEAGRFSAFIDEDMTMLPCSFMIETVPKNSLRIHSMIDIWQKSPEFISFREELLDRRCNCERWNVCHGGCPLFDINLCKEDKKNKGLSDLNTFEIKENNSFWRAT